MHDKDAAAVGEAWRVMGARALIDDALEDREIAIAGGRFATSAAPGARTLDARGLLALPAIVDVHGDGFERAVTPRPGVGFPLDLALHDAERQMAAAGVGTAFLSPTVSWEPGLRSLDTARALVAAWERARASGRAIVDLRLQFRWETFALEAVEQMAAWLRLEPRPVLALNDHTTRDARRGSSPKNAGAAERSGLTREAYEAMLETRWARRAEVPAAIERLCAAARAADCVMFAHDEASPEARAANRALGVRVSEFPLTRATAQAARDAGEAVVLGAPNALRGGSHIGAIDAEPAARDGLCDALASDYHYPAPLGAAFRMAANGMAFARAWGLVSSGPARAVGLEDRGRIAPGLRADLVLVDASDPACPRVVALLVAGRLVYLSEPRIF